MLQELKDEALERSLDISFQFPEDLNVNEPNSSRNNSSRDSSRNTLNDSSSFSAQEKAPVVAQFSKSTKQSLLGELPHLPTAKHVSPSEDLQTKAFGYEDEYDPVSITRNTKRKG